MNIGTLTITLGVDASGLVGANAAMNTFSKNAVTSLNTMSQRMRTFGYLASATITYPIVAAGKASIKMASDFEFSMQKIVGLAGVAQNSVTAWSNEILKMSPELAKRPQELAEALYFISSSGIKGAKAMDVLKISAKAATAGLGETQEVANLLTSALNAYAGTGLTASKAADILVAAVREGKAEADEFANSIGQIIPIASNLGVSFDQIAGGMAAITLTGASTSNAAVYLKGVFNSLVTASSQGEKALNKMGTSYGELRRVLAEQGLIALMQKLRDLQVKYGDELVGDVLPNIRAMTGFLSFAGKNFKYNTELMERVTNSAGSLGEAFAAVSDTLKVRMDRALAQANSSLIVLGKSVAEAFIPILEGLVAHLQKITTWFDSLTEAQKRHKLITVAIVAAMGPLYLLFSVVGYGVSGLISLITKLTRVWTLLNTQLTISKGLTTIFASKLGWIGLAITAVVGTIGFFAKKTKEAEEAQNGFNKATVTLNGSLTKLKELTDVDYSNMNFNQLFDVKTKALQVQKEASANIQSALERAGMSNEDFLAGKKVPQNQRAFVQTQVDAWNEATKTIKQTDAALDAMADQFGKNAIAGDKVTNSIKSQTGEVVKAYEAGEVWLGILRDIYESQYGQRPPIFKQTDVFATQGALQSFKGQKAPTYKFKPDITGSNAEIKEITDSLSAELAKSAFMNSVVGDSIDSVQGQISAYLSAIEELYDSPLYAEKNPIALKTMEELKTKFKELNELLSDQKAFEKFAKNIDTVGQAMYGIIGAYGNLVEAQKQKQLNLIDTVAKQQNRSDKWVEQQKEAINAQYARKQKNIAIAMTIINGAVAAIRAYADAGPIGGPVAAALVAGETALQIAAINAQHFKYGGTVPPGYPNDSYPALLTSGEKVIPPEGLNESKDGTVEFIIRDDVLYGILKRRDRKINSFR